MKYIAQIFFFATLTFVSGSGRILKQVTLYPIGSVGNTQYHVTDFEHTLEEGISICRSRFMYPLGIKSAEQVAFLNQTLTERNEFSHYWTSATETYVFETGREMINPSFGAVDFFGEPKCLTLRVPGETTQWDVRPCTETWPIICEI